MIFVTGGTGLVGSHLILELLKRNEPVLALRRKSSDVSILKKVFGYYTERVDYYFNLIHWVEGDLLDPEFVYETVDKVDQIYHTAAFVSFNAKHKQQVLDFNIRSTANIVNACLESKGKKLCHVSSGAALGEINSEFKVDEKSMWKTDKNKSVYALSKFRSEMEVWRGVAEGLHAVIVNPTTIIGPGNWDKSSPRFFKTIWNGMKFYTHGMTGFVGVHDVVSSMIRLMDKNIYGERFILSEGSYSYHDIFLKISKALHKKAPSVEAKPFITYLAYLGSSFYSFITGNEPVITKETINAGKNKTISSNEKICKELGITFTPIDKAIEETAGHFLKEIRE